MKPSRLQVRAARAVTRGGGRELDRRASRRRDFLERWFAEEADPLAVRREERGIRALRVRQDARLDLVDRANEELRAVLAVSTTTATWQAAVCGDREIWRRFPDERKAIRNRERPARARAGARGGAGRWSTQPAASPTASARAAAINAGPPARRAGDEIGTARLSIGRCMGQPRPIAMRASPMSRRRFFGSRSRQRTQELADDAGVAAGSASRSISVLQHRGEGVGHRLAGEQALRRSASRRARRRTPRCRRAGRPPCPRACSGRHVRRRAEDHAACVPSDIVGEWADVGRRMSRRRRVERLREAEVEHLDLALRVDLHVRGLQVAVDDALLVRDLQASAICRAIGKRLVDRHRSASIRSARSRPRRAR